MLSLRTFALISLFICSGVLAAFVFGFDLRDTVQTLEYDDEQEGLEDQVVIKFSHVTSEHTPKGLAARKFAELVEERTNGTVSVEIYANGALYNDQDEQQALKENRVQMIAPATSKLTSEYPGFQILDLPYAFSSYEEVRKAYEGTIGRTLLAELNKSEMRGMGFWYNGFKQMTSTSESLLHPSDFERMHFRRMPSPVIERQFQALDASTSLLPFNKTYENLHVEFINGQENTTSNIYTKKLYETQDHLTISNHGYLGYIVLTNETFWKNLSDEQREIIETSMEDATEWIRRHSIETNDAHLRELKRTDSISIHYLNQEQQNIWRQALEPVYIETEAFVGRELMQELDQITDQ
ncbi:DctP family TRAP transporter solute-binding subunit [Halobacillus kuroshimensis]|uniref:DctP family TRAP transporter solute-binding subunit n=1 Tax=Halobacillus kuroshimensis TaxID=302481 RepID=UPI0030F50693